MTAPLTYVDRRTGAEIREDVFASSFLYWACNAVAGQWLTRLVLSRLWASRLYGWWNRLPRSCRRIDSFVLRMGIDMSEAQQPEGGYRSFADFFARRIDMVRRPMPEREDACVSPVDGKILVYPVVGDESFRIKSHMFGLRDFLREDAAYAHFRGGSMAVIRLGLSDYHHVHYPVSCVPSMPRLLAGRCYIGGPYAVKSWMPFYRENVRCFTTLASGRYGPMLMAEIGGFAVATIRQDVCPGVPAERGQRKGNFELGGSTVVLLFQPGAIRFDDDLLRRSALGTETRVLVGERIGVPSDAGGRHDD